MARRNHQSSRPFHALSTRRKALFAAVFVAALLIAAELLARAVLAIVTPPPAWFRYDAAVGFEPRPGWEGSVFNNGLIRKVDERGFWWLDSEQVAEPKERPRIVVLSDSTGYGFNVQHAESWPEQLDALLPEVDVINISTPGWSSYQGWQAFEKKGLALAPDLVIASFNFNDRRYVVDPSLQDGPEFFARLAAAENPPWWERIGVVRALRKLLGPGSGYSTLDMERNRMPAENPARDLATLPPRVSLENYGRNLRAIATEAKAGAGAHAFLLVLGDHPAQTAPIDRAALLLDSGNAAEAARVLEDFLRDEKVGITWTSTLARLWLSRAYEALGRVDDARAIRMQPAIDIVSGMYPVVRDVVYQARMREAAAASGARLIEGAAVLNARPELFIDHCHFNVEGHRLIAEQVLAAIRPELEALTK